MTKPADSERTAKARERELKAREFREHGEWMTTMPANYPVGESSRWEDRYAAAFAASERQAVIEECAKLCCEICANGGDLPVKRGNDWTHLGVMPGEYVFCGANEVNELRFNGQ